MVMSRTAAAAPDEEGAGLYVPPAKRRRLEEQRRQREEAAAKRHESLQGQKSAEEEQTTDLDSDVKDVEQEKADNETAARPDDGSASRHPLNLDQQQLRMGRQQQSWEEQRRAIHGVVNRLNIDTIKPLIGDLFAKVNLIRMRGVLVKSLLQAATSNRMYAPVYASCVAVINTKLPEVGELLVTRAILSFQNHYQRKDKHAVTALVTLLGHLFHQRVVHELLILQILTLLLDGGMVVTDDSIEVAASLLKTVGYALLQVSPVGVRAVTERLRSILHEGEVGTTNRRVQHEIESLLELRKNGFRSRDPPIPTELDLVEEDDQITFEITLDDDTLRKQEHLDAFAFDPDFDDNERTWSRIRAEILGEDDSDEDDEEDGHGESDKDREGDSDDDDDEAMEDEEEAVGHRTESEGRDGGSGPSSRALVLVQDLSDADLVHLRRQIYLTIMSAAGFEETAHKLAKMNIPHGREEELVNMLIECCSQERTFQRHYGMIAGRFCLLADRWRDAFMEAFERQYSTIHRLETNKLRNVAKLFAHLLHTDSIPWSVLSVIHLNEDETTSSSRIFLKILVQEMAEALGMARLKERFETADPERLEWFKELFPTDNVRKTRYAINFYTSIGLGPLTDGLRDFLKNAPKLILQQASSQMNVVGSSVPKDDRKEDDDSLSVSSSSSSSSASSSSTSSSSGSSSSGSRSTTSRSTSRSSPTDSSRSHRGRSRTGRSRRGRGRSGRRCDRSHSTASSSSTSATSTSSYSRSRRSRGEERLQTSRRSSSSSSSPDSSPTQQRSRRGSRNRRSRRSSSVSSRELGRRRQEGRNEDKNRKGSPQRGEDHDQAERRDRIRHRSLSTSDMEARSDKRDERDWIRDQRSSYSSSSRSRDAARSPASRRRDGASEDPRRKTRTASSRRRGRHRNSASPTPESSPRHYEGSERHSRRDES